MLLPNFIADSILDQKSIVSWRRMSYTEGFCQLCAYSSVTALGRGGVGGSGTGITLIWEEGRALETFLFSCSALNTPALVREMWSGSEDWCCCVEPPFWALAVFKCTVSSLPLSLSFFFPRENSPAYHQDGWFCHRQN